MTVLAMDMVPPPLNAEDCEENRSAGDLSDNSAQRYTADQSGNNRDSRGDQRGTDIAPGVFPVKYPPQRRVTQEPLDDVRKENTDCRAQWSKARN